MDNLQPDFLYDHIQPVRTDLIQGLWRTLRSQNETIAIAAYRVLGKLGGNNRKMIVEPQRLNFNKNQPNSTKEFNGPIANFTFPGYSGCIELSLEKVRIFIYIEYRSFNNHRMIFTLFILFSYRRLSRVL